MRVPPVLLLLGPPGHGVTAYGADVAAAVARWRRGVQVIHVETAADVVPAVEGAPSVHLHVTDRLLGDSPEEAATQLERLAAATHLTITMHDVPQASDGTMHERRRAAYTRMVRAANGVVVNSRHEQLLSADFLPDADALAVIPLGARVEVAPLPPAFLTGGDLSVLIAGFVYPGKGHAVALDAAADAATSLRAAGHHVERVAVRAIGGPSRGHEADLDPLRAQGAARGVEFEVTGFLDDEDFAAALAVEGIPVAAHEHVSASRSMLDWVERGRRPLVVDSVYSAEMDALRPGSLRRYRPAVLASRLAASWLRPELTRLPAGTSLAPTLDDVALSYLRWWGQS